MRTLGIDIRAGLHTGECEVTPDDVEGLAVHIAARVAAVGGPAEIVVSNTVRDLVAGSGVQFTDRGTHALKGLEGEWRLFTVAS
jgi:class 3 adenylate cyclase